MGLLANMVAITGFYFVGIYQAPEATNIVIELAVCAGVFFFLQASAWVAVKYAKGSFPFSRRSGAGLVT